MSSSPLPTPCIGTCSTVLGDRVCRGCRRYLHEVQAWNSYDEAIKARIWSRLESELEQVFARHYRIIDAERLGQQRLLRPLAHTSLAYRALDILRRQRQRPPAEIGLQALHPGTPLQVLENCLAELYRLAQAQYERAYRDGAGATFGMSSSKRVP